MSDPVLVRASALPPIGVGAQPEPSAAAFDSVVFYTAWQHHTVSSNDGVTFGAFEFTGTVFGGNDGTAWKPVGDESTIFAPIVDRFIWAMLYRHTDSGRQILRLAFTGVNRSHRARNPGHS